MSSPSCAQQLRRESRFHAEAAAPVGSTLCLAFGLPVCLLLAISLEGGARGGSRLFVCSLVCLLGGARVHLPSLTSQHLTRWRGPCPLLVCSLQQGRSHCPQPGACVPTVSRRPRAGSAAPTLACGPRGPLPSRRRPLRGGRNTGPKPSPRRRAGVHLSTSPPAAHLPPCFPQHKAPSRGLRLSQTRSGP